MAAKKDALPALVRAMADFHAKLHPAPRPPRLWPGQPEPPPEQPSQDVLDLLKKRQKIIKRLTTKQMPAFWSGLARRRRVQEEYVDKQWALWNATLRASDHAATRGEKAAALLFTMAVNVFSRPLVVTLHDLDRSKREADGTIVLIPPEEIAHTWTRDEIVKKLIPYKESLVQKRADIERKAEPLLIAAEQCMLAAERRRIEAENYPWLGNAELADALLRSGEYFKGQWALSVAPDPSVVERRRERDDARVRVVELATEIKRLYSTPSHGTTAEIAATALADTTIGISEARHWWDLYAGKQR